MNARVNRMLQLANSCELFHDADGRPYVSVPVAGHVECWGLESERFRNWLAHGYFTKTKSPAPSRAVQEVVEALKARALFDGPERQVFLRVAEDGDKTYIDLGDDQWQAIEVTPSGWRMLARPPVKFRRPRGMRPLPMPVPGGSINELRPFVNVSNDDDFYLLIGWLIGALCVHGPYPVCALCGEQGSAKSSTARVLRALVDPNGSGLRVGPSDIADLMIAAHNERVLAFDNLSSVPLWLSDGLCRVSSRGGFSTRQLYSDTEETLIEVERPVILTGIGELAVRSDLLDRTILLELPPIRPSDRRPEEKLWHEFTAASSRVFGALLDGVATALKCLPTVSLADYPRMADFVARVTAAESSFGWTPGTFVRAYEENRTTAHEVALERSPITAPLLALLSRGTWEGTATSLLQALTSLAGDFVIKTCGWPRNARSLSAMLDRLAPNLRAIGVVIERGRTSDHKHERILRILASDASDGVLPEVHSGSTVARAEPLPSRFQRVTDELNMKLASVAEGALRKGRFAAATGAIRTQVTIAELQRKNGMQEAVAPTNTAVARLQKMNAEELQQHIERQLRNCGYEQRSEAAIPGDGIAGEPAPAGDA